jgi:hypothetical protein
VCQFQHIQVSKNCSATDAQFGGQLPGRVTSLSLQHRYQAQQPVNPTDVHAYSSLSAMPVTTVCHHIGIFFNVFSLFPTFSRVIFNGPSHGRRLFAAIEGQHLLSPHRGSALNFH